MVASAATSAFGFVFWLLVARLYPSEAVGLASALISAVGLLAGLSYLGLGMGLIRFLPQSQGNPNSMINTAFTIGGVAAVVASGIFIAGLGWWAPSLQFVRQNPFYLIAFILSTIIDILWTLMGETFVARRRAGFVFSSGLFFGILKLILAAVLAMFFHTFGIFASWGTALGATLLLSLIFFLPQAQPAYRPFLTVNRGVLKEILRYSFSNYIAFLLWSAPGWLLPIIVLNRLGAEANAYFFIAWAIGSVLNTVSGATATSLFAEGSHEEETLGVNIWRSLRMTLFILVPAVVLVLAVADKLLLIFGSAYSENATWLLRLLAIASLPVAVNTIYLNIKRVQKRLREVITLAAFVAVVTIGLAYSLLPRMDIPAVGIAWLASNSVPALTIAAVWLKGRLLHRG
jgi:O-antigen/teichoic acid export membrane protein